MKDTCLLNLKYRRLKKYTFMYIVPFLTHSRVLNKRGGVRIIGGDRKWFDTTIIGGWNNRGGEDTWIIRK